MATPRNVTDPADVESRLRKRLAATDAARAAAVSAPASLADTR